MNRRRIRISTEIALTIALATVLSMFTVLKMPYGGSVSLGMLPLIVIADKVFELTPEVTAAWTST